MDKRFATWAEAWKAYRKLDWRVQEAIFSIIWLLLIIVYVAGYLTRLYQK
jgi:hypothetical protein